MARAWTSQRPLARLQRRRRPGPNAAVRQVQVREPDSDRPGRGLQRNRHHEPLLRRHELDGRKQPLLRHQQRESAEQQPSRTPAGVPRLQFGQTRLEPQSAHHLGGWRLQEPAGARRAGVELQPAVGHRRGRVQGASVKSCWESC